jgi:hypothetical protein
MLVNPINQKSFYVSSPDVNKLIAQINAALQNGWGNTTNGLYSVISGGVNNITSADYAFIGSATGAAATLTGQVVNSSYTEEPFISQASKFTLTKKITGGDPTTLPLTFNEFPSIVLQEGNQFKAWNVFMQIIAVCKFSGSGSTIVNDVYSINIMATIKFDGSTVQLVGSADKVGSSENSDASMASSRIDVYANTTFNGLDVVFTPPNTATSDTEINVMASVSLAEIGY